MSGGDVLLPPISPPGSPNQHLPSQRDSLEARPGAASRSRGSASSVCLPTVIDRVVARVRSAFGVEGSSLTRLGRRDGAASSSARAGGQATTSRSASLALATVRAPDGLAVTNLRDDTRFRHSRLASRHGMAFFAGYRVEVPTGEAVAVLAIFDRLPRTFSAQEMDLLRDHARLIEQAFTPAIAGSGAPESHGGVPGRRHNTAV
jgi:hypothetical protein